MRGTLTIFRQHVLVNIRNRFELFWSLGFPLVIMTILVLIFANMNTPGGISLTLSLVNLDPEESSVQPGGHLSSVLAGILQGISEEEESWLILRTPPEDMTNDEFLEAELEALELGQRAAVLVIPEGFDGGVRQAVMTRMMPQSTPTSPASVKLYGRANSQASNIAFTALSQVVEGMNREVSMETGMTDPAMLIPSDHITLEEIGEGGRPFSYVNYIIPGIIMMGFLMTGLSAVVENLAMLRDKGVLRRYFVTPITTKAYFSGLLLHVLTISAAQVVLVYFLGRLAWNAEIDLFTPVSILYLLFSTIVLLSFGFLVASLAKSANAAAALTNIVLYPMMFLGGLFFPVMGVPEIVRVVVLVNPVTYLINGLRDTLGVYPSATSDLLNLVVPSVWLILCTIISITRFRWEAR